MQQQLISPDTLAKSSPFKIGDIVRLRGGRGYYRITKLFESFAIPDDPELWATIATDGGRVSDWPVCVLSKINL